MRGEHPKLDVSFHTSGVGEEHGKPEAIRARESHNENMYRKNLSQKSGSSNRPGMGPIVPGGMRERNPAKTPGGYQQRTRPVSR
jgi:hypothetical protein